jgi:hypothetical protein
MKQIMFRDKDWRRLTDYLLERKDVESGAYGVFKISSCNDCIKFLVREILIPGNKDYCRRTSTAVALSPEFTEVAFQKCESGRCNVLDIHTHPWSDQVEFSGIDDREASIVKIPYLNKYLPRTKIAFIALGRFPGIARARYYDQLTKRIIDIDRICVI